MNVNKIAPLAAVSGLGLAIIALHFHALLASPMNDVVWGISLSQDPLGDLYFLYRLKTQAAAGCITYDGLASFPFGQRELHLNFYVCPSFLFAILLTFLTGKVVLSFNLAIMITFFVNYLVTYLAMASLLKDRVVALIPATLMTFSAYAYAHSWAHMGMMPLFYFPWFLASFVKLQETRSWKHAVGSALPMALALYSSPYYAYFLLWTAIAVFVAHVIRNPHRYRELQTWKGLIGAGVLAVALALPHIYWNFFRDVSPYWQGLGGTTSFGDDARQILSFSARPSDYLLPNVHNFLYGSVTAPLVTDQMPLRGSWSDEYPIYIGALPALGLLMVLLGLLTKRGRTYLFAVRPDLVLSLLLVMTCTFLLSLPHELTLFGVALPMPNALFRKVFPFRSYSRFAIVFLLALATLLALLAQRLKGRKVIAAALLAGCIFESMPEQHLFPMSQEIPYIKFLRERPEQVLMRFEQQNGQHLSFERTLTGKPAVNGFVNDAFPFTDLVLTDQIPALNMGHLGQMGAELLVVNGQLNPSGSSAAAFLEKLAEFPESQIEIWKIHPGPDPRISAIFQPLIDARRKDPCLVVPKDAATEILRKFVAILRS